MTEDMQVIIHTEDAALLREIMDKFGISAEQAVSQAIRSCYVIDQKRERKQASAIARDMLRDHLAGIGGDVDRDTA